MPIRVSYSNSLAAAVRGYLGLSQTELGRWLGVKVTQISDMEAGRKRLGRAPSAHLWVLANCLPEARPTLAAYKAPPPPPADPLPPAQAPIPAAPVEMALLAALSLRLQGVEVEAARVQATLAPHQRHAEMSARWSAVLPKLQAAVPQLEPAVQARAARWLAFRTAELADPALAPDPAAALMLGLRLALLRTEAATLSVWLGA